MAFNVSEFEALILGLRCDLLDKFGRKPSQWLTSAHGENLCLRRPFDEIEVIDRLGHCRRSHNYAVITQKQHIGIAENLCYPFAHCVRQCHTVVISIIRNPAVKAAGSVQRPFETTASYHRQCGRVKAGVYEEVHERVVQADESAHGCDEPMLKAYGKPLLLQQIRLYNNLYKPTYSYPFAKMWGEENARIAKWLKDRNRLTKGLTAKDYEDSFDAKFMERTYQKLGWKVPARAPFIPPDWTGKIGELPYPAYANVTTLKEPQPWPEKGDLTKDWSFNGKTYQP